MGVPHFICEKKEETLRLFIDHREVNKFIIKHKYPLSWMEDSFDQLLRVDIFFQVRVEVWIPSILDWA